MDNTTTNLNWVSSHTRQNFLHIDDPKYIVPEVKITSGSYDEVANENLLWGKIEERPWGTYQILYEDATCKVKKIVVNPGCAPSYQYHQYRQELWQIISGEAIARRDADEFKLRRGDFITIDNFDRHRIRNTGTEPLIFIEIQIGTYFGEDDIVRLDDDYGRK